MTAPDPRAVHIAACLDAEEAAARAALAATLARIAADRRVLAYAAAPVARLRWDDHGLPPDLWYVGDRVYADPYHEHDVTDAYRAWLAEHAEPAHPDLLDALAARWPTPD